VLSEAGGTGIGDLSLPIIALHATDCRSAAAGIQRHWQANRVGYKWPMVGGPLVAAADLVLLAGMSADGTYLGDVLPGFLVTGAGVGVTMVTATIAATNAAPSEEEGLASALLAAAQQLGFALGYAVPAGVASSATASYLASHPHGQAALAQVHGYRSVFLVAAAVAAGCSLFALLFVRWRRREKTLPSGRPERTDEMRRPAMDTLEVRHPGLAAHAVRLLLRMPGPVRRRGLASVFNRAGARCSRLSIRPSKPHEQESVGAAARRTAARTRR
jgi:MFS family permease